MRNAILFQQQSILFLQQLYLQTFLLHNRLKITISQSIVLNIVLELTVAMFIVFKVVQMPVFPIIDICC